MNFGDQWSTRGVHMRTLNITRLTPIFHPFSPLSVKVCTWGVVVVRMTYSPEGFLGHSSTFDLYGLGPWLVGSIKRRLKWSFTLSILDEHVGHLLRVITMIAYYG